MAVTTNVTNSINAAALKSTQSTSALTSATNDLGKDAFLKLLIAELSNQDPLNPMEDREFISQMATFSSLEQMQNMNKTMESMAEANKFSAVSYIGKAIAYTVDAGTEDAEAVQKAGIVSEIWFDEKKGTVLKTTDGDEVLLNQVEGVTEMA